MEDAVRACRDGLVSEDAAREDGPDGRLLPLHLAHLNGAGVGAQQDVRVGVDKERVLHVARWMLGREVEGGEDVPVVFDLRSFGHCEAEPAKDVDDLIFDDGDRVPAAYGRRRGGP